MIPSTSSSLNISAISSMFATSPSMQSTISLRHRPFRAYRIFRLRLIMSPSNGHSISNTLSHSPILRKVDDSSSSKKILFFCGLTMSPFSLPLGSVLQYFIMQSLSTSIEMLSASCNVYGESTTQIPSVATMITSCSDTIPMEHAKITFNTTLSSSIYIYGISDECYHCLYLPLSHQNLSDGDICIFIDTQHPFSIGYSSESPFSGCPHSNDTTNPCPWQPTKWIIKPESYHYDEYAHYSYHIHSENNSNDASSHIINHREIVQSALDKHLPLYTATVIIVMMMVIYNLYRIYKTKWREKHGSIGIHSGLVSNIKDPGPRTQRVVALDAFRGMSLIIMIFVNSGGGGYWWLNHSTWNGLTVADLVFPWFIFIMGVAMAVVFPRKLAKLQSAEHTHSHHGRHQRLAVNVAPPDLSDLTRWTLTKSVLFRGVKLFLIGLLIINHAFDLKHIRVPGVLQYFAISYIINSVLLIWFDPIHHYGSLRPRCSNLYIPEVTLYWKQLLIIICILTAEFVVIFVPDIILYGDHCGSGYMGPGGIGDYGQHIECTGAVHRFVDLKLFGSDHVYQSPTVQSYYATGWYDPEGFMGALSATVMTFFGVLVGRVLTIYQGTEIRRHRHRIMRWMMWCIVFGIAAGILCGFKQNGGIIPVNKNMWSLSFILCQASTGTFVLIVFYVLIDVMNVWSGMPFQWLGSNSIVIYVGSEVFADYFPFAFEYGDRTHAKLLLSNLIGVSMWIAIAGYLFKKKRFYAL